MNELYRAQLRPEDFGLGALFRLSQDAIVVVDLRTDRVVLLNSAAERLLSYTSQQAAGLPIERLVPFSERSGLHALIHGLVETPRPKPIECRIQDASANGKSVELTAHRVQAAEAFALLVYHDITERKLAEERELERARLEGMLRAIETLGVTLERELQLAEGALGSLLSDSRLPAANRTLARHALQSIARATARLAQLQRAAEVEDVEDLEIVPGETSASAPWQSPDEWSSHPGTEPSPG